MPLINCLELIKMALQFVRGCKEPFLMLSIIRVPHHPRQQQKGFFFVSHLSPVTRRLTVKLSRLPYQGYQLRKQSKPDQDRITKDSQVNGIYSVFVPLFPSLKLKPVGERNGHLQKWFAGNWLDCTGSRLCIGWIVSRGQTGQRCSMVDNKNKD